MAEETPLALEYERPCPPPARRFAAPAFVSWMGLATFVVGVVILLGAFQPDPDDVHQSRFGVVVACFGVTWWVMGLILRAAMRR